MIRFTGVSHAFRNRAGTIEVLRDFSLELNEGQTTAVLGPSGCGKTTLLNITSGLISPTSGSVTFSGGSRPRMAMVFQEDLLLPWRRVRSNVALGLELGSSSVGGASVESTLSDLGLLPYAHLFPNELSGGLRRRAALGRALLANPEVLLLDEPLASLDYVARFALEELICRSIRDSRLTAVVVTHDAEEALAIGDRVVVLSDKPARVVLDIAVCLGPRSKRSPRADRTHTKFSQHLGDVWRALGVVTKELGED